VYRSPALYGASDLAGQSVWEADAFANKGAWTTVRVPLKPAPKRLRDMLKERQTMSELMIQQLRQYLPETQVITDELRLLAYGTDASFYRLTPQVIAVIESETELQAVLKTAKQSNTPVTFRAAGTSLSGQAITDGVWP
jgi:hypothetical protein